MHKLTFAAIAASVSFASCSGQNGASPIPPVSSLPNATVARASMGLGNLRALHTLAAPAGWSATATGALDPRRADGSAVAADQPMTIRVGLQLRHVSELQSVLRNHGIVDRQAFVQRFSPTDAQVDAVERYLSGHGFRNITVEPNRLIVSGTAARKDVERAFATRIAGFSADGKHYYGNVSPAYVPRELAGNAIAVLGLNDAPAVKVAPQVRSQRKKPPVTSPKPTPSPTPTPVPSAQPCTVGEEGLCARFYDPPSFQIAYDAANAPTAAGTSMAIMTEGTLTQAIADFRTNEQQFGLAPASISIVQVEPQTPDTSGNSEWTLDMTYSTGMAANVKHLYLYNFATLADADIVMAYNRWASDDVAQVGNSSFGGCEVFPYTDGAMLVADEALVEAAAQGQTMFASSGDNGGYCNNFVDTNGAPGGIPMVEWPAASPYVVAVGGTDLFTNPDGTYLGEASWEAGGGGLSQFEYSPYWENGVQPVGTTPAGYSYRGVPDVAMDASLETGALLYTSGAAVNGSCTPCTTGGTSLASPLAAGAYARMQSAHHNALGFGAIAFYAIYTANPSASETSGGPPPTQLVGGFHDVLTGTNGLFTALPRYDYTTGLGSFDVAKTNAIVQ